VADKHILLIGKDELVRAADQAIESSGGYTYTIDSTIPEKLDALIALSPRSPVIDKERVMRLSEDTVLFDAGIGSIHADALEEAESRGLKVIRIDFRPTIAAAAIELIHMKNIVQDQMGRGVWDGVTVVAGGFIGKQGDIIVDNFNKPTRIIGVADGTGGIAAIDSSDPDVQTVRTAIMHRQLEQSP
jgi:hypothetical protein